MMTRKKPTPAQPRVAQDVAPEYSRRAPPPPRYLDKWQAAAYLRLGLSTFRTLVREGQIPVIRIGPSTARFDIVDLDAFAASKRRQGKAA